MVSETVGECVDCGATLVPSNQWRKLPPADRAELRVRGSREHAGRSLCHACWVRRKADGTVIDFERRSLNRDDLLDEWQHFTKSAPTYTANVRLFAVHLGRSYPAVKRALTRTGVRASDYRYGQNHGGAE